MAFPILRGKGGNLGQLPATPIHIYAKTLAFKVGIQTLAFKGGKLAFKLWLQFMQKPSRKHRSAFTKNTLLSVLYNFRIQSFLHF
jgi:hypothetical protein